MYKKLLLLSVLIILISSCSTIPDPSEESNSLIIGKIVFDMKNIHNTTKIVKSGILINIMNLETGNIIEVKSKSNGIFYSMDFNEGKYVIKSLSYKIPPDNYSIGITFRENDHPFTIKNPGVNNIGTIEWGVNGDNRPTFEVIENYNEVFNLFEEKYNDSLWLNENWNNIIVF